MEIRVRFDGGPINGEMALSDSLEDVKVFFPPNDRSVLIYKRDPMQDELTYYYDPALSAKGTADYDRVSEYFRGERSSILAWVEQPDTDETTTPFSDTPIPGDEQ